MIQPQFEILHISKPIGLAFEGFDLIDQPFHARIGNMMCEIIQEPCPIAQKRFRNPFELFNA